MKAEIEALSPPERLRLAAGPMTDGKYHTKAGSEVTIRHGRLAEWSFDWFEEPDACCECVPYAVDENDGQPCLLWACEDCGGGSALLFPGAR